MNFNLTGPCSGDQGQRISDADDWHHRIIVGPLAAGLRCLVVSQRPSARICYRALKHIAVWFF
jgi:hypothetical protein